MDEIFGYMDGRFEVSLADSTMMWIVHYAMNRAQEKMKTKTGVIERLNEISKFYELAVMQLEGCLSFVHAETESSFLEGNHEDVLTDLREIKDRLQGRLKESEFAISEKDRELTQRLENELKLRHALELKERELVSLGVSHGIEIETTEGHNNETDKKKTNEDSDGDFCELKTSVDQQRLEPEQDNMLGEPQAQNGIDRRKVEEMGSDIDILKQTMDLAFGKVQSTLFSCEMGPKERQWKLKIEKDIMSIFIRSFMREFQENVEAEVRKNEKHEKQVLKCWHEHWPQLMNEVTSLQNELSTFSGDFSAISSPTSSSCSALSSPTYSGKKISQEPFGKPTPEERSHGKPDRSPQEVELVDKMEKLPKEEENEDGSNNFVAKLIKNHESIIRRKIEELNRSKHGISQDKKASSSKKERETNSLKEKFQAVTERLDNLVSWNAKLSESLFNQTATRDEENLPGSKLSEVYQIDTMKKDEDTWGNPWEKVKEVSDARNELREEIGVLNIEKVDLVEEFGGKFYNFELEKLIEEHVCKYYLRAVISEWNETIERNIIERNIRDDINLIVFSEAAKDISSNQEYVFSKCQGDEDEEQCLQCLTCGNKLDEIEEESTIKENILILIFRKTVEEYNNVMVGCNADSIVREELHQIVFAETLKNFVNVATIASREHSRRENSIQDNFLDQLEFVTTESLLKEDVCNVLLKNMHKELKLQIDNHYMENLIKEQIHQVIMFETLNDIILMSIEVKSPDPDNNLEGNCSSMTLNQALNVQGEENLTIVLLESLLRCFEAEENLMLSAQSEIKEHSKQLDLGSERGDLHEHELFEDLLTEEEQTFSSLTSKVENALQQLGISKALLRELGTSLGHKLRDSENFHNQIFDNEELQLKLSSFVLLPLWNLIQKFAEFERMVDKKFDLVTVRLENLKCCLDPIIDLFECLRSKKLLYQKAFIRRCQNLQKAEAEVDLLGDQVDALLTLLEKVYATLHQYAPALQQYFEVSNILELIKTELINGSVHAASLVT